MLSAILMCASMLTFNSCKKENNENKPPSAKGTAEAVVIVDNQTLRFSSVRDSSIALLNWNEEQKNFVFSMLLKDDNSDMIMEMMIFPVEDATGAYPLADGFGSDSLSITNVYIDGRQSARSEIYTPLWLSQSGKITSSSGTINITSMTENSIKGNFNIILYNYDDNTKKIKEMTVTQGSFDVPLIRS